MIPIKPLIVSPHLISADFLSMPSSELKFAEAKMTFAKHSEHRLADEPLELWVLPSDRHLPTALIRLSLRELLSTSFTKLSSTRGVGDSKLVKLVSLVQRALNHLEDTPEDKTSTHVEVAPEVPLVAPEKEPQEGNELSISFATTPPGNLGEQDWAKICRSIKSHSLEHHPLGRFAKSLSDLPKGLWCEPLSTFVSKSLFEVQKLPGYGEQRTTCVIKILQGLSLYVVNSPTDGHLEQRVLPASVNRITTWINSVLSQDEVPDYFLLCQNFVLPLLQQLEVDLGSELAEMVERRLGADGTRETLQEVAEHFDLTRERIRQLTLRAPKVMEVRWPEGKHLLDDFYEKFRSSGKAAKHVDLIQRTLEMLFDFETSSGATRETVIEAWETAGRRKETPMSENEIFCWLGGCFPRILPESGFRWIAQEAQSIEYEGRILYFSNDRQDRILHQLYSTGVALTVSDLVDVDEKEERNLRNRLLRDLRFTEDEEHCMLPTEHYGFVRDSNGWHVDLVAAAGHRRPTRTLVSIDNLATLAQSGLLCQGVVDVTAWGFFRFVNEQLTSLFNACLPPKITPFVLADMVVRQTGGRIRPMRRRRLRWDAEGQQLRARGKRGWIGYVVERNGVPIVIDELGGLLNHFYQDYAPYVLGQLDLDPPEDGDDRYGATLVPGIAHKIPQILVPSNWEFDEAQENVSLEIKFAVARAIGYLNDGSIEKDDISHIPWFVELVERHSYGEEIWEPPKGEVGSSVERNAKPTGDVGLFAEGELGMKIESNGASKRDVDDLLSKFL